MARTYRHPAPDELELADVLRALADPIRLQIVEILLDRTEMTCAPMAEQIGIADSTLSHHLRLMREAGITRTTVDGAQRRTTLRRADLDQRFPGLLDAVAGGLLPPGRAVPPRERARRRGHTRNSSAPRGGAPAVDPEASAGSPGTLRGMPGG